MAANSSAAWVPPPPPARMGAGRVIAVVLGALMLLPAFGLVVGGGVLLWADTWSRNDDGYLFTASDDFSTAGHAMLSDRIDLETDADWLPLSAALGTARLEVTGTDTGEDVFVGVGPTADVEGYLDGVERTVIDDLGLDTSADQQLTPGGAPSGPPIDQDFWTAQSSGPGTQRLSWEPAEGSWTLVIMNADGSAGVSVDARIGATAPALGGLAWGLLAGGVFLGLVAVVVLVLAVRRRPAAAPGMPYGVAPGGPPPYWTPPVPVDRNTAADAGTPSPATDPATQRPRDG